MLLDNYVIQEMCARNLCDEPEAQWERGVCSCPCHDLDDPEAVADFARGLRGEDGPQS